MKWPRRLTLIRHGESTYNFDKKAKLKIREYQDFLEAYKKIGITRYGADEAKRLALYLIHNHILKFGSSDALTPLTEEGARQARLMAEKLKNLIELPDIVFVSPYLRTIDTFKAMQDGWSELATVEMIEEDRIREKEHGLLLNYSDYKIFESLYPEQRLLKQHQGPYYYKYPQGENIPDVRERLRSWQTTLVRDFTGLNVMAITHHISILALRTNLERLTSDEYIRIDKEDEPINCGVTIYKGDETLGRNGNGKLVLEKYNEKLY